MAESITPKITDLGPAGQCNGKCVLQITPLCPVCGRPNAAYARHFTTRAAAPAATPRGDA